MGIHTTRRLLKLDYIYLLQSSNKKIHKPFKKFNIRISFQIQEYNFQTNNQEETWKNKPKWYLCHKM